MMGIFFRMHNLVPDFVLIKLYYSMDCIVYTYIIYCNLAWIGSQGIYVDRLFMLQIKLSRLIASEGYLAHSNPLFNHLKILKFIDIHVYQLKWIEMDSFLSSSLLWYVMWSAACSCIPVPLPIFPVIIYNCPWDWNALPCQVKVCVQHCQLLREYYASFYWNSLLFVVKDSLQGWPSGRAVDELLQLGWLGKLFIPCKLRVADPLNGSSSDRWAFKNYLFLCTLSLFPYSLFFWKWWGQHISLLNFCALVRLLLMSCSCHYLNIYYYFIIASSAWVENYYCRYLLLFNFYIL